MNDRFVSFFLYDSHFNISDQSPGDIIYYLSNDEILNQDENRRYIVTGVITAINDFCKIFDDQSYCNYMITNGCENAFLPIGNDLFFYLSLKLPSKSTISSIVIPSIANNTAANYINSGISKFDFTTYPSHIFTPNTRKSILKSILTMIKEILFLSIQLPKRNINTGKFDDSFKKEVNDYLPKILELIDWNNISYTHIWRSSVFITKLPQTANLEFLKELKTLQNQNNFIYGLILTFKNKVVAHTTESKLANILNFLVRKKYKIYFPIQLKRISNSIQWIIGIINHENGCVENKQNNDDFMSVVTPPIFWNNQSLALAALKYNMAKLIILIDLTKADLESDLYNFKQLVEPLLHKCDSFNNQNNNAFEKLREDLDSRFKKNPGAKLSCNFDLNTIQMLANRIQTNEMEVIDLGIYMLNEADLFIKKELMKSFNIQKKLINKSSSSSHNNVDDLETNDQDDDSNEIMSDCNNIESLIPFHFGFSMYYEQRNDRYSNLFMKIKHKGMSHDLELFHMIDEII